MKPHTLSDVAEFLQMNGIDVRASRLTHTELSSNFNMTKHPSFYPDDYPMPVSEMGLHTHPADSIAKAAVKRG